MKPFCTNGHIHLQGLFSNLPGLVMIKEAEEFLEHLVERSTVKDYVDTLSGSDLMTVMGTRAKEGEPYRVNDLQMVCATE